MTYRNDDLTRNPSYRSDLVRIAATTNYRVLRYLKMKKPILLLHLIITSALALCGVATSAQGTSSTQQVGHQQDKPVKNVILIGANGETSREIIPRVLEQGDVKLTLFLRRASRMQNMQSDRVSVVEGDASNLEDLIRSIRGQDIVISTMGGTDLDVKTANIVKAMKEVGARRIIVTSAGGIYDELPEPFNAWDKARVGRDRVINRKTADVVEQSTLAYTVLRPVWLTDKPTEQAVLTRKGEKFKGTETSRASLARFIADLVKDPTKYVNESLGISQPNTDGDRPAAYR
jgi:hypothetical protein